MPHSQPYPKRIRYGNRRPLLLDPTAELPPIPPRARRSRRCAMDVRGRLRLRRRPLPRRAAGRGGRVFAHAFAEADRDWPVRKDPFSTYRSGFEVRTYRLCRRVLMFHHFPEELGTAMYLVRSTEFDYRENRSAPSSTRVVQSGHRAMKTAAI